MVRAGGGGRVAIGRQSQVAEVANSFGAKLNISAFDCVIWIKLRAFSNISV